MTKVLVGAFTLLMTGMLSAAPQAPAPGADQAAGHKTTRHRKHKKKTGKHQTGHKPGSKVLNAPLSEDN